MKQQKMVPAWFVVTPAGKAGPYFLQAAAREVARPFGWRIVREEVPFEESSLLRRNRERFEW